MFLLIYFLFFTVTYTQKCLYPNPIKYEQIYLCQENLNSTSIRIWLYLKINPDELNIFSYYLFTLRVLDLIEDHRIHLKDRFEKPIGDSIPINAQKRENNTLHIHNLLPGHYEICVNFFNQQKKNLFYRSSNSCLHIPWNTSKYETEEINHFIHVLFMILIILLLVTIAFTIYAIRQYFKSPQPSVQPPLIENPDEDSNQSERVRFLVNQHFGRHVNPLESLVRKRIHQRYAHRSPDLNDM